MPCCPVCFGELTGYLPVVVLAQLRFGADHILLYHQGDLLDCTLFLNDRPLLRGLSQDEGRRTFNRMVLNRLHPSREAVEAEAV